MSCGSGQLSVNTGLQVRETLMQMTLQKDQSGTLIHMPQVHALYTSGGLRMPCIRLVCIDFNAALYRDLCDANARHFGYPTRPDLGGEDEAPAAKRRRTADRDSIETGPGAAKSNEGTSSDHGSAGTGLLTRAQAKVGE